jgi:hypothetical protein
MHPDPADASALSHVETAVAVLRRARGVLPPAARVACRELLVEAETAVAQLVHAAALLRRVKGRVDVRAAACGGGVATRVRAYGDAVAG